MSASRMPTRAPICASATARLTATVVLPTPPLPLATAMMFFTGISSLLEMRLSARTWASILIFTCRTPGKRVTAALASCSICVRRGQAGVVRTTVKDTSPPSIWTSLTMFNVTRSWCSSGSWTLPRASRTASLVRRFSNLPNMLLIPPKKLQVGSPRLALVAPGLATCNLQHSSGSGQLLRHQTGNTPSDLDRKVGAPVPWVNLAHAREIKAGHGCLQRRDIMRVIDWRYWLGVRCFTQPGLFHPAALEIRVDTRQGWQKPFEQLFFIQPE